MRNLVARIFVVFFVTVIASHCDEAIAKDYYRTFEIIETNDNSITLKDNDGNVVEVEKDPPEDYKTGYKVRYDSVRKRLRPYRWQDYLVTAVSDDAITLQHKSGDTLVIAGNFADEFKVGDAVRYDSIGDKLQPDEDTSQWLQYTVIAESRNQIVIQSNEGEKIILKVNNSKYPDIVKPRQGSSLRINNNELVERSGIYIPMYEVGEKVRYDAKNNKLKKESHRTYDWQDYEIKEVTEDELILVNEDREELTLDNIYGEKYEAGDRVKYDRLNNLLKKAR